MRSIFVEGCWTAIIAALYIGCESRKGSRSHKTGDGPRSRTLGVLAA